MTKAEQRAAMPPDGFYWVRLYEKSQRWEPAEVDNNLWIYLGHEYTNEEGPIEFFPMTNMPGPYLKD